MARFLHLADIHLGYDMYGSAERSRDFFYALQDVFQRYALGQGESGEPSEMAPVDAVLIAGDLFEHRHVLPAVLNQAQLCLGLLKEAGIPVIAIEGNHDHRPYGTKTSWLRYLASWGWLILLEPNEDPADGDAIYEPWDAEQLRGGYIDLPCGMRILGTRWYGSSAPQMIPLLAEGIRQLSPGPEHTVMMLHHGLQGQIARYQGALDPSVLLPLKEAGVDYLALGHIHRNYTVDDWIFNPGSIEANSMAERQEKCPRGVYLVELAESGIHSSLQRDYRQRDMIRLDLTVSKSWTAEEVVQQAIALVDTYDEETIDAIVELRIDGQVGFNRLDVNVRDLRDRLWQSCQALVFLLRYDVMGTEYDTVSGWDQEAPPPRLTIETAVFTDLLAANTTYRDQTDHLARGLIDLKERLLLGYSDADLHRQVETLLNPTNPTPNSNP